MDTIKVVSPFGTLPQGAGPSTAARLRTLTGARIGLLDNGKPNADRLLAAAGRILQEGFGALAATPFSKVVAATPCPDAILLKLLGFDAAVVGVGD